LARTPRTRNHFTVFATKTEIRLNPPANPSSSKTQKSPRITSTATPAALVARSTVVLRLSLKNAEQQG
jgi:hypothetical protein